MTSLLNGALAAFGASAVSLQPSSAPLILTLVAATSSLVLAVVRAVGKASDAPTGWGVFAPVWAAAAMALAAALWLAVAVARAGVAAQQPGSVAVVELVVLEAFSFLGWTALALSIGCRMSSARRPVVGIAEKLDDA